jgi:hypothetical protein
MVAPTTEPSAIVRLRRLIDDTERAIVEMPSAPDGVHRVLLAIDQIHTLIGQVPPGIDLRGERSRVEGLRQRIQRNAAKIVPQAQAYGQLDQLADSSSWRLAQQAYAVQRSRRLRRLGIAGGSTIVVLLLLFVVLPWLFPAPPRANLNQVQLLVENDDLQGALAVAQAEQRRVPGDPQALLWVGALQQRLGNQDAAERAWDAARQLLDGDVGLAVARGPILFQLGEFAATEADARTLLTQRNTAPAGQYLLGQVYSAQNRLPEALEAFQQAATLADETGDAAIAVAAKLEVQNILQRPPEFPTATP